MGRLGPRLIGAASQLVASDPLFREWLLVAANARKGETVYVVHVELVPDRITDPQLRACAQTFVVSIPCRAMVDCSTQVLFLFAV